MRKLFFIITFIVFAVLSTVVCADAKSVKFAVVSDIHISLSKAQVGDKNSKLTESMHYLQEAVKQINGSDADFVIFLGDAVDRADKVSIVIFAKIINELKKPYYVCLGNHDVAQVLGVDKKEYYHLINMFSHNKIRKLPYIKKSSNNLVFIFMDGVNEFIPGATGFYKEHELLWLDKKLTKYKNKRVVIVQHYPLVPPRVNKSHEIYNADEYIKLLNEHDNVISVISGHYHTYGEQDKFNMKHISIPALVSSGEYSGIEIEKKQNGKYILKTRIFDVK